MVTSVRREFVFLLIVLLSNVNPLFAQGMGSVLEGAQQRPRFELGEIVVTASRVNEPVGNIPRNVSVITSEDIEQANSNNVVDLLAKESGLNLHSHFGHDKQAGIDIRGMGAASSSNIVVMIDGIRLNSPDMAGPDLSSIPLDQIERVEIIHGTGSVIYGDGAVGGVINIITKKGQKTSEGRLFTAYGSYAAKDFRASYSGRFARFNFNLNADYYDSDGYRDNGDLEKQDTHFHVGYVLDDNITLDAQASLHKDTYGLPGYIKKEDSFAEHLRKATYRPLDSGETTDMRFGGGIEIDLDTLGSIKARCGDRLRENPYIMGYNPLKSEADQTDRIEEETRNFFLNYDHVFGIGEKEHRFQCGFDHYKTEYIREELSKDERKNSRVDNDGFFVIDNWSLMNDLVLHLGYRWNVYRCRNRLDLQQSFGSPKSWVNGESINKRWVNDAYDLGINYSLSPETHFFTGLATSFRFPNVDELAEGDADLHPQEGIHLDIGGGYQMKGIMECNATLFHIRMKDEIYYSQDAVTDEPLNRNYDETTIRYGLETDIKIYPTNYLYFWGNYTFTEARLKKEGAFLPLVPRHETTIGLEWQLSYSFLFCLTGTMVSSCFDGNDESNDRYEKLRGYEIADAKLTYKNKGWSLFLGVNNIFNEYYSTIAYSENYYPMPTRNYCGGLEWRF